MYDVRGLTGGILVRISDDREGRALGVKRQEEDGRHLAERLGLKDVRIYVENDVSASAIAGEDRQDFEDYMADWLSGVFQVPIAYTTGRLTRDNIVAERVIQAARQTSVSPYYVASPWCDLNTAAGRRMYRSLAVNDTGEAEDIQERVQRKKLQDAREGKTSGGRRLYGYSKIIGFDPKKDKDVCDPYQTRDEEIDLLQEGMRRTLGGDSQLSIVMDWNSRGLPSALGGQWTVGKFKRTLLNASYVVFDPTGHPSDCPCLQNAETGGTRTHYEDRHRAKWPGIFTSAQREALLRIFDQRAQRWNHGPVKGRSYLLTGITRCAGSWPDGTRQGDVCGGIMYGQGKKESGRYIRRYACKKYDNHGIRIGCCTVFRIAEPVELLVAEAVLARFESPEVAKALAPSDNEERMAEVVQELAELQIRREQLAAEYAAGEHAKEDYHVMSKVVRSKIEEAEAEKRRLLSDKAKSLALPKDGGLRQAWETAGMEWRASVIRLLVEKIVIHPGRPGQRRWPDENGWNFDPDLVEIVWLH